MFGKKDKNNVPDTDIQDNLTEEESTKDENVESSSNVNNDDVVFTNDDLNDESLKPKWFLSSYFLAALVIAVPFSVMGGPVVFLIVLVITVGLLILQGKENKKLLDNIKNKMILANEKYINSVPLAEKELESINNNIKEKEINLESISNNINSLKDELSELEKTKSDKMNFINEYNSKKEDYDNLEAKLKELEDSLAEVMAIKADKDLAKEELREIENNIKNAKNELVETNEEVLLQSFGLYEPKYAFENSEEYMDRLRDVRADQKDMIRDKSGVSYSTSWTVDGSRQKGKVMTNKNIQAAFKLFNAECDIVINKVTYRNIESSEKRIRRSFEQVNNLYAPVLVSLKRDYLNSKVDELYLYFEYLQKKQEEKEEQAMIREQMREEAKIQKEIEAEKKKIAKEKAHFHTELSRLQDTMPEEDNERAIWEAKIAELKAEIERLTENEKDVLNKENNAKAGYVYIISNIGSFGENVYKIGVTRRLDPMERVNELGSASVPFKFDVHAMIFSEDCFSLETALHKAFTDKRVNKANMRKEFFNVTLDEIKEEVEKNFNKTVEYTKYAEAMEYRQSLKIAAQN